MQNWRNTNSENCEPHLCYDVNDDEDVSTRRQGTCDLHAVLQVFEGVNREWTYCGVVEFLKLVAVLTAFHRRWLNKSCA
mgnify:CR=1 FL=1